MEKLPVLREDSLVFDHLKKEGEASPAGIGGVRVARVVVELLVTVIGVIEEVYLVKQGLKEPSLQLREGEGAQMLEELVGDECRTMVDNIQGEKLLHRQRSAEIVPLEGVAPQHFVEVHLLLGLDTLNDKGEVKQGGHAYNAADDLFCPG